MAIGWVQTGFFDTRTRPAGPPLLLGPNPFNKQVFFLAPNLTRQVSTGPVQPLLGVFRGPLIQPNLFLKKKKNTNTNQSTLLLVKSLNSIYHLWKKQNSDFYIYG